MKIAIIGSGFSGLAIAWYLRHSSLTKIDLTIFDQHEIGKGASGIAAGLLHPYSGAHAKLNWRGKEGFQATKELIEVATKALKRPIKAQQDGILRLALNTEQIVDFQKCAEQFPNDATWYDENTCQQIAPGCIRAPGLWIREGMSIYSSLYLQGLWKACQSLGVRFKKMKIFSLTELEHSFDIIICAAGAESLYFPEITPLPIHIVKGQILELSWPRNFSPLSCALNSQVYLLMTESRTSCLIGSTYERGFANGEIDVVKAQKELLPKAIELFPSLKDASLLNCYSGLRAVTPGHRPLMQKISSNQWILTGMGSKGLLYHALFAKELVQMIEKEGDYTSRGSNANF